MEYAIVAIAMSEKGAAMKRATWLICLLLVLSPSIASAWERVRIGTCTGPTLMASSGPVKVEANPNFQHDEGEKDAGPHCGSRENLPDAGNCVYGFVRIPKRASICEIRYYRGDTSEVAEVKDMRNAVEGKTHKADKARTGSAKPRIEKENRVIRIEYKNWNRGKTRYFAFEVYYQTK